MVQTDGLLALTLGAGLRRAQTDPIVFGRGAVITVKSGCGESRPLVKYSELVSHMQGCHLTASLPT